MKSAMKKRMIIMLVLVGVLLGGIVGFNMFKGYMMQKYMASAPVPSATVSATKVEQCQDLIKAMRLKLSAAQVEALNAASAA